MSPPTPDDARARSERVKAVAVSLGFDACGIAAAGDPDPEDRFGRWLDRGCHADMRWLADTRDIRRDVRLKLPGAQSVVVVARSYHASAPPAEPGAGRVARYAWGRDYHRVLRKPLNALADAVRACGTGDDACYCSIDSGPVLEKFWAQRAGVGWLGKHSLALREGLGSWFVLGVVLTTVELAPDAPAEDRCGACSLCIDACPTGAIVEPRTVDARRCLSYHTVENRAEPPASIAALSDGWVFGCDICQEVCPWNREVETTSEVDFLPRPGQARPDPARLLAMTEDEFRASFAGSSLMRAGWDKMRRNARAALDNARPTP